MKAGFLARKAAKQAEASHPAESIEQPAPPPTTQPGISIGSAADCQLQQEESWQQCLKLLRSDIDEQKFVGLLLVTKLLPQGTAAAIQQVLDAVGLTFIQRLLLPLHRTSQQQQQLDEAKLQQQHLSVVLGLSILSVSCRLPAVNSSEELLELLPSLLKVAAAGGVGPGLLQQTSQQAHRSDHVRSQQNGHSSASSTIRAEGTSEAAPAADALECALACVASDPYHCAVALDSDALPLTVMALQTALQAFSNAMQSSSSNSSSSSGSGSVDADPTPASAGVAASRLQAIMLSIQLLGLLLSHHQATAAAAQCPGAAAAAVVLLSTALGTDLGSSSSTVSSESDAAVIQLEAQHTLLLLLPLIQDGQAADLLQQAAAAACAGRHSKVPDPATAAALAVSGDWPAALRHGLCQLLRSRTGAVQRHSALRLAAAITDILGDSWLLPKAKPSQQQPLSPSKTKISSSGTQQPFLLVMMEILAIETPLLLSDAMNPEAVVSRADISMATRPAAAAAAAASPQQQQGNQPGAGATIPGDMDIDSDSDGDADRSDQPGLASQAQPLTVQQILQQVQQQEALASSTSAHHPQKQQQHAGDSRAEGPPGFQVLTPEQHKVTKSLQQRLAELQLPDEKAPGPGQQRAGARADQLLPACFQLLECCCDVLVRQADALEQQHDTAAAGADGVDAYVLPALGYKEVQQLMMRLQQVSQVILEFLAYGTSPPPASAPVNPLLTAGAVRVLGRFLADAPDVHSETVQNLLPQLLTVGIPGEPAACGVSFLLPALLMWTSSSNSQQQHWVAALLAEDQGLAELGRYTASIAAAAAGSGGVNDGRNSTGALEQSTAVEEGLLGTACQVLQQVLSSLPTATAQPSQRQYKQQALQTLVPVLDSVCKWANTCIPLQHCRPGAPAAVALGLLQAMSRVPWRLPVLLAAASFTGRLLVLLRALQSAGLAAGPSAASSAAQPTLSADVISSAGQLLCWGCAAGWSCQLMQVLQDGLQQESDQEGPNDTLLSNLLQEGIQMDMFESIMSWMEPIWEDAELGELWDVCLDTAADLLLEDFPPGLQDVFHSAAWVVAAKQNGSSYGCTSTVMVAHVELQMLLKAVGTIG